MILVFKKGLEYKGSMNGAPTDKDSNTFPLMSVPLDMKGEETDLNDFQWWAYTDKWKKWLDANPREWKAESEESKFDKAEQILESIVTVKNPVGEYVSAQIESLWETGSVISFDNYAKLLEASESSGSRNSVKKFIKLGYAIEKLIADGSLLDSLKIEDLEDGKKYAVVIDPLTEEGDPVQEGRQALRITKVGESAGVIIADMDYSLPIGDVKDTKSYLDDVVEFAKDVAIGGAGLAALYGVAQVAGSLFMGWTLLKSARGIYKNFGRARQVHSVVRSAGGVRGAATTGFNALKSFASKAFGRRAGAQAVANAARVTLPSGAFVEGGLAYSTRATGNVLLKGAAEQSVKSAAARAVAQGGARAATTIAGRGAAAAATASGVVAAEASNPVGWIIAAASVVGSGVNQIWNWLSDKQAPRYGEVDDFAYGEFSPKSIPTGRSITICWTSDGGAGGWGFVVDLLTFGKDDTRTTMELVKLGEYDDRSVFVLIQVNSEMFEKVMSDNDLVLLSFSNNDKFERGYLDNDDLEFQTVLVPDITELTIGTSFVGYSSWDEMEDAYRESPDSPVYVPAEARSDYQFHYKNKDGKEVNVTGTLVKENELTDAYINELVPGSIEEQTSESLEDKLEYSRLLNENKVLSFSDFSAQLNSTITEAEDEKDETIDDPEVSSDKPEVSDYETELDSVLATPATLSQVYSQIPVISYKVNSINFVNPEETGSPGSFTYFLIGEESMNPSQNQPVLVESASEDAIEDPRFGLKTYVPPVKEEEVEDTTEEPEETSPEENINIEDVDTSGDRVETTRGDVQIKSKSGSLTIKDRDVDGGINIFDEFATSKLKRELNIEEWENITSVKVRYDDEGEANKVTIRNRFAPSLTNRKRVIRKGEEGFESALNFARSVEDGISFTG
jgi:hypothetical protein